MKTLQIATIVIRLAIGGLFIYGGIQKFIPKPPEPSSSVKQDLPDHVVKIKSYIGGLKQTGYFWPMLGTAELICGILLVSQYLALLGAVMLIPITLNIFLFHIFLEPHDIKGLILTALYLLANLALIGVAYPKLKKTFLNFELT